MQSSDVCCMMLAIISSTLGANLPQCNSADLSGCHNRRTVAALFPFGPKGFSGVSLS
jgi:hypothetical protein